MPVHKSKGFKGATYETQTYDLGDGRERVVQLAHYPDYFGKGPRTIKHEWINEPRLPKLENAVVVLTVVGDEIVAEGRTYDVRQLLKGAGFRWRPNDKVWYAPADTDVSNIIEKLEERGVDVEFDAGF